MFVYYRLCEFGRDEKRLFEKETIKSRDSRYGENTADATARQRIIYVYDRVPIYTCKLPIYSE